MRRFVTRRPFFLVTLLSLVGAGHPAQSQTIDPNLGRRYFAEGNFADAEAAFSLEIDAGRRGESVYYNRALVRFNQRNYVGAKADLNAHLALSPRSAAGLSFRAQVVLLLGDAASALTDANNALSIAPDDFAVLVVRGRARLALGQQDAAFADFTRVLEHDPRHAAALLGRGDVHLLRDNLADAKTDFLFVLSLTPQDPDAHYKLGLARFRAMESASAVQSLETAARIAPDSTLVARALGCAYVAAGDFDKAAAALQSAVALDPAGATYARLLLHLTQRRLGHTPTPSLLAPPAHTTAGREWQDLLLRYLRGEATEDELLFGAQYLAPAGDRAGRWCEAHYYLGAQSLLARDTSIARFAFQEAVSTGKTAFAEHTLAQAELDRMVDHPNRPKSRLPRRP